MTLTDPREALADQSNFIGYLMGLASLGHVVHALADGDRPSGPVRPMPTTSSTSSSASRASARAVERLAEPAPSRTVRAHRCRPATERQVAAMTATLASSDFLRAPVLATAHARRDSRSGTTSWCTAPVAGS